MEALSLYFTAFDRITWVGLVDKVLFTRAGILEIVLYLGAENIKECKPRFAVHLALPSSRV